MRTLKLSGTKTARRLIQPHLFFNRGMIAVCFALRAMDVMAVSSSIAQLSRLSIEELANIEVTSVSKRAEPLSDAAAAIYVISAEDIRRSGVASLPEALRLAPNLEVARQDSGAYAISARGFNIGNSNKLLVLIDGRTVYSPLHAGVFWDAQDVMLEDIERIEVISGPGGTLWGANAVNGVINIITRSAQDTQGTLLALGTGNAQSDGAARYGGTLGEEGSFRLYANGFRRDNTEAPSGASRQDAWHKSQVGFRSDWRRADNSVTLQGDAYDSRGDQMGSDVDRTLKGNNLLGRWTRKLENGASLEGQAYYDHTQRSVPGLNGYAEQLDTYDVEAKYHFLATDTNDIVWGGGYRLARDDFSNGAVINFLPPETDLKLTNVFGQDTIALGTRWHLTLGAKLEHNSYTSWESQPNARLAWKLDEHMLLWSAISRAVRTPSRVDRDFYVFNFPGLLLRGGPNFQSEKLTAYELGYRAQPLSALSYSVSVYYNVYDDLRTIEPAAGGTRVIANKMEGHGQGLEAWTSYEVSSGWRLYAGYNRQMKNLRLKSDSQDVTSIVSANNDPRQQFTLRSLLDLPYQCEFDLALRAVSGLPAANVSHYSALDARLGWHVTQAIELSLAIANLTDSDHAETGGSRVSELRRAAFLKVLWSR